MELLHTLEEGAPNLLRATKNASSIKTEKGLRAVAFFMGAGVRKKIMHLTEFKAYSSVIHGSKKTLSNPLKRVHIYDMSD